MSPKKDFRVENEDSFVFNRTNDDKTSSFPERTFCDEDLQTLPIELPPTIEEILGYNDQEKSIKKDFEVDKTFWDNTIEETFEFKGMSPGWKFQKNFKKESILYLVEKREIKNFDIKLILNHLGILDKTRFCENLLQDDVLMAIDSAEELRTWATKNSNLSQ